MPTVETPPPAQYQFLLPAWGEKYIQTCLRFMLPSHMAPGNIAALPAADTLLRIFTRTPDIAVFRSSPLFRQYERDFPVSFESIDDLHLVKENPYQTLTACHERALATAGPDTAFVFINPDGVYADGTYAAIRRRFQEGKRAIMVQGLRASLPDFAAAVDALRPSSDEWPDMPPHRLARLVLDALHPLSLAHLVDGTGNKSVGSYYWRVGRDGLVCRCIHTHPLAVRPLYPVGKLYTTIDHEYVRWSCPDPDTVHLVADSDELIAVEVSDPGHMADWVKTENVPDDEVFEWMRQWTNGYHRAAFTQSFVVHAAPVTAEYDPVEQEAAAFANRVLAEFSHRHPHAGPDQFIISQAIRWEQEAAEAERRRVEAERAAEEARFATEKERAEAEARAKEEAEARERVKAAMDAQARAEAEARERAEAAARAAEDARRAEEARVAAVAREAETQAARATQGEADRAAEAAQRSAEQARATAEALRAATAAPAPVAAAPAPSEPPAPPSLPGRVWGAVRKFTVKAHRQVNRPLYNRQDQTAEQVARLIEQRQIDDHRLKQAEVRGVELTAWLHNEEASRTADVLRQSEVIRGHADAARQRFESMQQQLDVVRQKAEHHEHRIALFQKQHEIDRQLVSGAFDRLSAAVHEQLDVQQRNMADIQRQAVGGSQGLLAQLADVRRQQSAQEQAAEEQRAATQQQLAVNQEQWAATQEQLIATQKLLAESQQSIQQMVAVQQDLAAAVQAVANTANQVKYTHDRLLRVLSLTGVINFADRDESVPSLQPPLGYSDYDMATFVYRPAFERAIRYLQGNDLAGCVAEFGTYRGFTARTFAELLLNTQWQAKLYLYDSFAGLPPPVGNDAGSYEVQRRGVWVEGAMTPEADIAAQIRASVGGVLGHERLAIFPGFFEDSLPAHPPTEPVAILHVDADLYLSARFVLQFLSDAKLLIDGAVVFMDDFNCNAANPTMGERKALTDFLADNPRWSASPWFAYGWHGQAFFLHEGK